MADDGQSWRGHGRLASYVADCHTFDPRSSTTMTTASIHPILVPFPSSASGIGIESVAILTPIAAGVQTVATTTARAARAREKARKKRERQLDNLAKKEQNFKDVVEANIAFLKSQAGKNLHPMTTGPERKVAILVESEIQLP
jgi:hypothetical protein